MGGRELRQKRRSKPRTATQLKGTRRFIDGLFSVDRLLRHGAHPSLKDLAATIEASPRTVQRYFEFLGDRLGAEVIYDRDAGGYRYADGALEISPARLTDDDLLAL